MKISPSRLPGATTLSLFRRMLFFVFFVGVAAWLAGFGIRKPKSGVDDLAPS